MAITQGVCTSFKQEVLQKQHDLKNDALKIALYTSAATLSAATTAYSASNEASGTGYTAGGKALTGAVVSVDAGVATVTFNNVVWTSATISAAGALIYNTTAANKAVAVINFGGTKSSTDGDFSIIMPVADATNAIIQLA